jgi:energy-coupling factor transporter ATP-binding protein EcfA2
VDPAFVKIELTKRVHDGLPLDVAFELGPECSILFGRSGCSKTTTLRCIAGLVRPDAGRVRLNSITDDVGGRVRHRERRYGRRDADDDHGHDTCAWQNGHSTDRARGKRTARRNPRKTLSNYRVTLTGKSIATTDDTPVTLRSAVYDAAARAVTLTPTKVIKANQFLQVVAIGANGLRDVAGNALAGNGGAGTNFSTIVGRGTSLAYTDRNGDGVTLRLTGGGVMELTRAADGEANNCGSSTP